jgi:hypothetical protein
MSPVEDFFVDWEKPFMDRVRIADRLTLIGPQCGPCQCAPNSAATRFTSVIFPHPIAIPAR